MRSDTPSARAVRVAATGGLMFLRKTALQLTVAGLAALALAATATPAFAAGPAKPGPTITGTVSPHGAATPLENGVEQTVSGTEKYVYDTEFIYWSATALRSEGGKPSLSLYADEDGSTLLAKSNEKRKKTEFVVVDSNHAPVPTTYFPKATSKGGDSTVELDKDAVILFDDEPMDIPMSASDVVVVTDVFLEDGFEYTLQVTGSGDAGLYLMQSDAADSSTWYQARKDAIAKSDKKGPGKPESVSIAGTGDWYGLVLINNSGSGTYTLSKLAG
jgi:hypothetical protein